MSCSTDRTMYFLYKIKYHFYPPFPDVFGMCERRPRTRVFAPSPMRMSRMWTWLDGILRIRWFSPVAMMPSSAFGLWKQSRFTNFVGIQKSKVNKKRIANSTQRMFMFIPFPSHLTGGNRLQNNMTLLMCFLLWQIEFSTIVLSLS
jgi:hypothetical protein